MDQPEQRRADGPGPQFRDRGVYADLPLGLILDVVAAAYPRFEAGEAQEDDPAFSA